MTPCSCRARIAAAQPDRAQGRPALDYRGAVDLFQPCTRDALSAQRAVTVARLKDRDESFTDLVDAVRDRWRRSIRRWVVWMRGSTASAGAAATPRSRGSAWRPCPRPGGASAALGEQFSDHRRDLGAVQLDGVHEVLVREVARAATRRPYTSRCTVVL